MKKYNVKKNLQKNKANNHKKLVSALYKCAFIKSSLKRKSNIKTDEKSVFDHDFCSRNLQWERINLSFMRHLFTFNCIVLKLVSAIFYQIFIFSPNDSPSKTIKNVFYFIEKALFILEIFKFL